MCRLPRARLHSRRASRRAARPAAEPSARRTRRISSPLSRIRPSLSSWSKGCRQRRAIQVHAPTRRCRAPTRGSGERVAALRVRELAGGLAPEHLDARGRAGRSARARAAPGGRPASGPGDQRQHDHAERAPCPARLAQVGRELAAACRRPSRSGRRATRRARPRRRRRWRRGGLDQQRGPMSQVACTAGSTDSVVASAPTTAPPGEPAGHQRGRPGEQEAEPARPQSLAPPAASQIDRQREQRERQHDEDDRERLQEPHRVLRQLRAGSAWSRRSGWRRREPLLHPPADAEAALRLAEQRLEVERHLAA